jgi:chorismate mutase
MAVRAFRGATQLDVDERSHLLKSTAELLTRILHDNKVEVSDLISITFSATPDIRSEFPAVAARELGLEDVPLMCFVEMDVQGSMPRVIRILLHAESKLQRSEINHLYLRGAQGLRTDLAK